MNGMKMNESTLANLPLLVKIGAVIIGAIFSLTLSGDIDKEGRLKLNFGVFIKVTFSAFIGFLGGEFLINYFSLDTWSHASQGFIMMMVSVFGMLLIGIAYQTVQITLHGKSVSEVIIEVKKAFQSIIK